MISKSLSDVQLFLLLLGGTICVLIFLFSLIVRYQSSSRKKVILHLEISTAILLYADFFNYIYLGDVSQTGFWAIRISNFLLFFMIYVELLGLRNYLRTYTKQAHKKVLVRMKIISIISYIGIIGIFLNLFTGFVYTINAENVYCRGPLYLLSYIAPFIIYTLILSIVIQYKKIFPKLIYIALLLFAVLPLTCAMLQVVFYGLSLMNLSICVCAIVLFILSLVTQNHFLIQIASREKDSGLPNSYGFITEMKHFFEIGTITNYDAFYFDIRRMGLINRKYGGDTGSVIIVKYSHILRDTLDEDEVLGRLGGNFFMALIKKENTKAFLDCLAHTEVSFPFHGKIETVVMSSVAGVYGIESDNIDSDQIMNNVSMAANIAKHVMHRPYVFLTPELQKQINDIKVLQEQIPLSMERGEIKPYYQPKVDVSDDSVCGAEALVRWKREGDIISPGDFIPALEQNETICGLDFYMLDYVCRDLRKWLDEGRNPPTISVNFSRKNLGNSILAEEIYNVLKKYNIPENLIQVEITETIDEYPLDYLKRVVLALQNYGISTALDDFGTGSASINLIKEVPFNVLKIDKSFIETLTDKDKKILGHIISIADDVGADVISEGVETEEQLSVLKTLGCTKIQGFYFSKPLTREEFETFFYSGI